MKKHIIWLAIGLLLFALILLILRCYNPKNSPEWAMPWSIWQAAAIPTDAATDGGFALTTTQPEITDAESAAIEAPKDTPNSDAKAPAKTPKSTEIEAFLAAMATINPTPAALPSTSPTATASVMPAVAITPDPVQPVADTPTSTIAPSPSLSPTGAAPLPSDTTVMAEDAAELTGGADAFPRELYMEKPHMRGDDIKKVQQALKDRGFNVGPIDGIFGTKTQQAIMTYQAFHEIYGDSDEQYGRVDQITWDWLF